MFPHAQGRKGAVGALSAAVPQEERKGTVVAVPQKERKGTVVARV